MFIKKLFILRLYYDIYHFSCFRFYNLSTFTFIIELIDEKEKFIHSIFLLLKCDFTHMFEIQARIISEKLQNIWQEKPFFLTYVCNPILVRKHFF